MTSFASFRQILPPTADARLVRLSPDSRRLAYVRGDESGSGVWIAEPETGWNRRLAGYLGPIEELAWSPDGERLAWVIGTREPIGSDRVVAWAETGRPGEAGRIKGSAFTWSPGKPALFVVDPAEQALFRCDVVAGKTQKLADVPDGGDADYPSRIAITADSKRIAFTARNAMKDFSEVWVLARDGGETTCPLLTRVPGAAVHIHPIWSPKGVTLALYIVHPGQERSVLIAIPRLEGDGEVLYTRERLDPPAAPAWSPSGRYLAFVPSQAPGDKPPHRLSLLDLTDPRAPTLAPLVDEAIMAETIATWLGDARRWAIRFPAPNLLAIDGGAAATVFTFNEPL